MPVFISMASDQLLSPAERAVTVGWHTDPSNSDTATAVRVCVGGGGVHAFARVCAHMGRGGSSVPTLPYK